MSRYLRLSLACLVVTLLFISASAQAPPSADTYVTKFSPSTNFGFAPILAVQEGTITYIQFDLSALPEGAKIAKATLRLYVNNVLVPGSFDVYQVNKTWSEKALTYSNAQPLGASATGGNPVNISASSLNQFIVVDITGLVKGWLDGTIPNHGIALALTGGSTAAMGSFSFDSKENPLTGHQPELAIATETGGCHGLEGSPAFSQYPPECVDTGNYEDACCECYAYQINNQGERAKIYKCFDIVASPSADAEILENDCREKTCTNEGLWYESVQAKAKCREPASRAR